MTQLSLPLGPTTMMKSVSGPFTLDSTAVAKADFFNLHINLVSNHIYAITVKYTIKTNSLGVGDLVTLTLLANQTGTPQLAQQNSAFDSTFSGTISDFLKNYNNNLVFYITGKGLQFGNATPAAAPLITTKDFFLSATPTIANPRSIVFGTISLQVTDFPIVL